MTATRVAIGSGLAARVRPGPGPRVLWVHGYTMHGGVWAPLWDELAGWHHVAVDLPGHGKSRPFEAGDTLPALAGELADGARAEGIDHVVAVSFGTMIALQMAVERPQAFRSVVLCAPGLAGAPTDDDVAARYEEMRRRYRTEGPGPRLTNLWMRHPPDVFAGAAQVPELWNRLRTMIDTHRWAELRDGHLFRVVLHRQEDEPLETVGAAVHLVVGEHEMPAFVRCADVLERRLPDASRSVVAGAGHLALLEQPAATAPIVRRFVTNHAA